MQNFITKKLLIMITLGFISILLVGCGSDDPTQNDDIENYNSTIETVIDESVYMAKVDNPLTDDNEDLVDHGENDFKPKNTAVVILDDDETVINNAVEETLIYMKDGNLIVESTKKMTLIVSGTLNGSIIVYKPDGKLNLVLDEATINSTSGPAINIQSETRSFLVLTEGTTNNITDGTDHPPVSRSTNTKAAIFSEEQLIISGEGELNITGRYRHGITSDDYIKIISGKINILSASSDGLHANDYIVIDGGTIDINANSNGIEAEKGYVAINGGKVTINSVNDAIETGNQDNEPDVNPYVHILNGIIDITTQKQGIKSTADTRIYNGAMTINSTGDAISTMGTITIYDGILYAHSLEEQSLDGDLGVVIYGGTSMLVSDGAAASIESDNDGAIAFHGGTIVVAGTLDVDYSHSQQGYVKIGNIRENDIINIKDDESLMTVAFLNNYYHVVLSSPEMNQGSTLDVLLGGTIEGDNIYGLFLNGTYKNGTVIDDVTVQ